MIRYEVPDRPVSPPDDARDLDRDEDARDEAAERENDAEPPEPDGECFRGGEAEAYLAETQARIQRELK